MTRRFVFGLAAGLLALSLGAFEARAGGLISLPTALPNLEIGTGNYAVVSNLQFSNFQYTPSASPPTPTPLPDSGVQVASFTSLPSEPGITFNGSFTAAAGQTVDIAISYVVSTTDGSLINDAYLQLGGVVLNGGNGSISIGETILNASGTVISQIPFEVTSSGSSFATSLLTPPETTIIVQKDITVFGGSMGATFSFVNQGFSSSAVPEPASLALLGIGLSGLFTIRRFLKRAIA